MTNPHGSFIWYELITPDADAAGAFYADVVGWAVAPFGGGLPMDYRILSAGDAPVGGVMALPVGLGGPSPGWYGYVGVDDVDASVAEIVAAGGRLYMPAQDLPDVGRIAMVADAQGAAFYVMRGARDEASGSFAPGETGHCSWNELSTADPEAAIAFYGARFGWTSTSSMPMGDVGGYHFLDHGATQIGAIMGIPRAGPPPRWNFYFEIGDIDAAGARLTAGGGKIHHGPAPIPGDRFILHATDPHGLFFGLVGSRQS